MDRAPQSAAVPAALRRLVLLLLHSPGSKCLGTTRPITPPHHPLLPTCVSARTCCTTSEKYAPLAEGGKKKRRRAYSCSMGRRGCGGGGGNSALLTDSGGGGGRHLFPHSTATHGPLTSHTLSPRKASAPAFQCRRGTLPLRWGGSGSRGRLHCRFSAAMDTSSPLLVDGTPSSDSTTGASPLSQLERVSGRDVPADRAAFTWLRAVVAATRRRWGWQGTAAAAGIAPAGSLEPSTRAEAAGQAQACIQVPVGLIRTKTWSPSATPGCVRAWRRVSESVRTALLGCSQGGEASKSTAQHVTASSGTLVLKSATGFSPFSCSVSSIGGSIQEPPGERAAPLARSRCSWSAPPAPGAPSCSLRSAHPIATSTQKRACESSGRLWGNGAGT